MNRASAPNNKPSKREQTRARVIAAAIDCIYEQGFNAAHTNVIAERAGVSWGVLQYHFGDKDGLLQAVLDYVFEDFATTIGAAKIKDGTHEFRLRTLIEIIWSLVSQREYRVSMSIMRNINRQNSTINEDHLMELWANEIAKLWQRIFLDSVENTEQSEIVRRVLFATLRGFADELNPNSRKSSKYKQKEFDALAAALAYMLKTN